MSLVSPPPLSPTSRDPGHLLLILPPLTQENEGGQGAELEDSYLCS